jgi:hypothetical protein
MFSQVVGEIHKNFVVYISGLVLAGFLGIAAFFWRSLQEKALDSLTDHLATEIQDKKSPLRAKIIALLSEDIGEKGSILAQALQNHTIGTLSGTVGISTQVSTVLNERNTQYELPIFAPENKRVFVLYDVVPTDPDRRPHGVYLRVDNAPYPLRLDAPDKSGLDITKFIVEAREAKRSPPTGTEFLSASELGTKEFEHVFKLTFSLDRTEADRPVHISVLVFVLDPVWMSR